jgi:mRNA interferase YafQ
MKLIWDPAFKRAFRKHAKRLPHLQEAIFDVLDLLEQDAFAPSLGTHKLRGQLDGYWSCSAAYDCRIIFTFIPDPDVPNEQAILLLNLGSHDEVY